MAKLNPSPICAADIKEYVDTKSGFAFELRMFNHLSGLGFKCDHGATYEDTITEKVRQYDIRATWTEGPERVWMSVECKQLAANNPLVVLRVPRTFEEGRHDLVLSTDLGRERSVSDRLPIRDDTPTFSQFYVAGNRSIYNEAQFVGKSCAQVGRESTGGITGSDKELFSRWTQAISSAKELVQRAYRGASEGPFGKGGHFPFLVSLVLPVVVVPEDTLWAVDFGPDGLYGEAIPIDRCPYCINISADYVADGERLPYTLTHLEFVTPNGLTQLVTAITHDMNRNAVFARDEICRFLGLERPESLYYGWPTSGWTKPRW